MRYSKLKVGDPFFLQQEIEIDYKAKITKPRLVYFDSTLTEELAIKAKALTCKFCIDATVKCLESLGEIYFCPCFGINSDRFIRVAKCS